MPVTRSLSTALVRHRLFAPALACATLMLAFAAVPSAHAQTSGADIMFKTGMDAYRRGDFKVARAVWKISCDGGTVTACNNLGSMHENGQGADADLREARKLYQRACDGGYASGCSNLGALVSAGKGGKKDEREARGLYQRACDGGDPQGCYNLGVVMANGKGGPADLPGARGLFQRACTQGHAPSCDAVKKVDAMMR